VVWSNLVFYPPLVVLLLHNFWRKLNLFIESGFGFVLYFSAIMDCIFNEYV